MLYRFHWRRSHRALALAVLALAVLALVAAALELALAPCVDLSGRHRCGFGEIEINTIHGP